MKWHKLLHKGHKTGYIRYMNHIEEYIHSKGYTVAECRKPAVLPNFPCEIYGRRFETQEEYLNALHDFLNSN